MSFTEKKFVAIHCDECDEQYDPKTAALITQTKTTQTMTPVPTDGNWMETKTTTVRNTGI